MLSLPHALVTNVTGSRATETASVGHLCPEVAMLYPLSHMGDDSKTALHETISFSNSSVQQGHGHLFQGSKSVLFPLIKDLSHPTHHYPIKQTLFSNTGMRNGKVWELKCYTDCKHLSFYPDKKVRSPETLISYSALLSYSSENNAKMFNVFVWLPKLQRLNMSELSTHIVIVVCQH